MKYTAEEVRARFEAWAEENGYDVLRIEPDYNDGFTAAAWHGYQAAYAERIERTQAGVTVDVVELAIAKMAAWATQNSATLVCHGSMRAALLAVWPGMPARDVLDPPAQAAQVDPAAKPHTLADFVRAPDAERAQIGQQVATRVDEMMAEPVAQAAPVVDLHDRIEFALRDAGFGLDEASTLAERATAEPATHDESGVIRHVGDSRFESWFSEYVVGQNGAKQQARDAYGAGLAEQAERLAAKPARSVDVAKVREVIVWLRSGSMAITANAGIAADKLETAIKGVA